VGAGPVWPGWPCRGAEPFDAAVCSDVCCDCEPGCGVDVSPAAASSWAGAPAFGLPPNQVGPRSWSAYLRGSDGPEVISRPIGAAFAAGFGPGRVAGGTGEIGVALPAPAFGLRGGTTSAGAAAACGAAAGRLAGTPPARKAASESCLA
jgi:hypothetical protein